ncbi:MAG: hypothetical protein ABIP71_06465 [Verrucomicrobiota bacterium]
MKTSNDPLEKCVTEQNTGPIPVSGAKKTCLSWLKMLFVTITIIAIALTYQTVKQAIGLHRAISIYEENSEIVAKVPVHISFAHQKLPKANGITPDRIVKTDLKKSEKEN